MDKIIKREIAAVNLNELFARGIYIAAGKFILHYITEAAAYDIIKVDNVIAFTKYLTRFKFTVEHASYIGHYNSNHIATKYKDHIALHKNAYYNGVASSHDNKYIINTFMEIFRTEIHIHDIVNILTFIITHNRYEVFETIITDKLWDDYEGFVIACVMYVAPIKYYKILLNYVTADHLIDELLALFAHRSTNLADGYTDIIKFISPLVTEQAYKRAKEFLKKNIYHIYVELKQARVINSLNK